MMLRRCFLYIFWMMVAGSECATAANYVWNGSTTTWDVATAWIPNAVPGSSDTVTFNSGGQSCIIPDKTMVAGFSMEGGYTGTLTQVGAFTVSGDSKISSGKYDFRNVTLTVGRDFSRIGGIMEGNPDSQLHLIGTGTLDLSGGEWINNISCAFEGKTTTLISNMRVTGLLTLGKGLFDSKGGVLLYGSAPFVVLQGQVKGGYFSYVSSASVIDKGQDPDLIISGSSNNLGGDITCNILDISQIDKGNDPSGVTLDTKGYSIKANYLILSKSKTNYYGRLKCNGSRIVVAGDVFVDRGGIIDADTSRWYIGGSLITNGVFRGNVSQIGYAPVMAQTADFSLGSQVAGSDGKPFSWTVPMDVWADVKGNIYVLDAVGVWVLEKGQSPRQLINVKPMANLFTSGDFDGNQLWLGSSKGIERFSADGTSLGVWKPIDSFPDGIERIFFDHQGGIYAWCPQGEGLIAYDSTGRKKWSIKQVSDEPSELQGVSSLVRRANGDIYVSESWGFHHRISILTAAGKSKGRIPCLLFRPRGMCVDGNDNLYVLTDLARQLETPLITVFNGNDERTAEWVYPAWVPSSMMLMSYGYIRDLKAQEAQKLPLEARSPLAVMATDGKQLYIINGKSGVLEVVPLSVFDAKSGKGKGDIRLVKSKQEVIRSNKKSYTIEMGGTSDSVTTRCTRNDRSLYMPDIAYTIANTGSLPVRNPRIAMEGQPDFYSLETMVQWLLPRPDMTDEEKAFAVWNFVRKYCDWDGGGATGMLACYNPYNWWGIKHPYITVTDKFNGYGAPGACGCWSAYMCRFARDVGLKSQQASVISHITSYIWYDGKDHYFDAIGRSIATGKQPYYGFFCLMPDNKTIAGYNEVVRDQWLVHRMGDLTGEATPHRAMCFLNPEKHTFCDKPDELGLNNYLGWKDNSNQGIILRPGEQITRRYEFFGYSGISFVNNTEAGSTLRSIVNGEVIYAVDFSKPESKFAVEDAKNVEIRNGAVRLIDASKPGSFILRVHSPTPILIARGTLYGVRKKDSDQISLSFNFDSDLPNPCKPKITGWKQFWSAEYSGEFNEPFAVTPLEEFRDYKHKDGTYRFPQRKYELQFNLSASESGDVAIKGFHLVSMNQTSMNLLPHLRLGKNLFHYVDDTDGAREVAVIYQWRESQLGKPSSASPSPIFPENGAMVKGAKFTFKWQPPIDQGGSEIIDWQFQASTRPDFAWPITPRYDRWLFKGTPEIENIDPTSFRPNVTYYWRVRAMNADNIWGPWSQSWKFQCALPGTCRNVMAKVEGNQVILSWDPPVDGTKPVKYEIYTADEAGFIPRYKPSEWLWDTTKPPVMEPANVFLVTSNTQAIVVGSKLKGELANKCHFRVSAIDANESRGCPSDFASAPHPFIFTEPNTIAKAGESYLYAPETILTLRQLAPAGERTVGFPNRDILKWRLKTGAPWMKIDPNMGVITGMPTDKGAVEVIIVVEDGHGASAEQQFTLHIQ